MFSFLNNCLQQWCYSLTPEQWEILQQDIAVISQDYKSCKNYLISWKKNKHYHYTSQPGNIGYLYTDWKALKNLTQQTLLMILTRDKLLSTTEMCAINPPFWFRVLSFVCYEATFYFLLLTFIVINVKQISMRYPG